jgi:hypothetical protein
MGEEAEVKVDDFKGFKPLGKNFITSPKIFPGIIFDTANLD